VALRGVIHEPVFTQRSISVGITSPFGLKFGLDVMISVAVTVGSLLAYAERLEHSG
jgi:hypothetical protein